MEEATGLELITKTFGNTPVRLAIKNGEPYFCLGDICKALDAGNPSQMRTRLNPNGIISNEVIDCRGRRQQVLFVSEQNLYKAVLQSRKPSAEAFSDWVTGEVLPSIRKTGGYIAVKDDDPPEVIMAKALKVADNTINRYRQQLETANKQIEQLTPAAEYTKKVLAADNLHTANSIAVTLGISATALNKFLVAQDWIYKQGGVYYPTYKIRTKRYCDFHIVPYAYDAEGNVRTREHLKWTEEGRQAVIQLWREVHGLLQFGDVIL